MNLLSIFKKKKEKTENKDEEIELKTSSFSEATISKNNFNASKEATTGREILNEILEKRQNVDIEKSKGWFFEYKLTSSYNINAAKEGSNSRAIMLDSEISAGEYGVKSNSISVHDIEIVEEGELTGNKIQAKASNNYKDAVSYQDEEKYNNMQRAVLKGQVEEFQQDQKIKEKVSLDTQKNLTEKITHQDKEGKIIQSDEVELKLVKNKTRLKVDAYTTEIKEMANVTVKSGMNAAGTAFLLNVVDDIIENREFDFEKSIKSAGKSGVKVGGTALAKDIAVNKLKFSAQGFSTAMVAIDIGEDLKKIYEMKEKGIAKETIREEAEAMVYKVGVSFLSNMALIFPGGAAGSVAINYIGNKLIQKYFYSEISLQLRELRERNNEEDKIYKMLQEREKELNNLIEKFTILVEETCNERKEVVNYLKNDFNSTSISNTSMKLTKKNIVKTSNEDIENLFKDELSI